MTLRLLLTGLLLATAGTATLAQATVYRCGKDGRSYSDTPCAEGRAIDAADPRNAEQQRAALDTAERERQLADTLARERRQRDKAARGQLAATLGPTTPAAQLPVASALKKSSKKKYGTRAGPAQEASLGRRSAPP
jgi:hypothetical protein